MSRFGEGDRDWMNEVSDLLESRASQVGDQQALKELTEVLAAHLEYYWTDKIFPNE